jgi:hypothetical protein
LNKLWRTVKFTVGWTITDADETAIAALPAPAWIDGLQQDGTATADAHVAELTAPTPGCTPGPAPYGCSYGRAKPSARHTKKGLSHPYCCPTRSSTRTALG